MAGGKETPRQKLIGIMYLVLLALLALQVGAEIMVKFEQLNDSLGNFVKESQDKSNSILSNISEKVKERGNRPKEVDALKNAQDLHKKSSELITYIEELKEELIAATDGRNPETGEVMGKKDTDKSSAILLGIGDKKDGKAYELKTKLDAYIEELNVVSAKVQKAVPGDEGKTYHSIALDGKDDPLFVDQESGKEKVEGAKTKDFAHLNFDHTPMIASLAFLTEKQAKIATYEGEILSRLKGVVGASDFKFDEVFAMASPEAKVVAAGTKYSARLFVTARSSSLTPKFKASKGSVKDNGDGSATVSFKAGAGSYDKEGKSKQVWTGEITIIGPDGAPKTFKHKEEYIVTKPVIQIGGSAVPSLYMNCANPVQINVPALGAAYDPAFAVSKGSYKKGSKKGEVIVYPSSGLTRKDKVGITVKNDGMTIGTEYLKVRPVPKPELVPYVSASKPADLKNGHSGCPAGLIMKAIPDEQFKQTLPNEARFAVTKWEITLARGSRPVGAPITATSSKQSMGSFRSRAQAGDRLIIEVKEVKRKNSRGQMEKVKMKNQIFTIPIN